MQLKLIEDMYGDLGKKEIVPEIQVMVEFSKMKEDDDNTFINIRTLA